MSFRVTPGYEWVSLHSCGAEEKADNFNHSGLRQGRRSRIVDTGTPGNPGSGPAKQRITCVPMPRDPRTNDGGARDDLVKGARASNQAEAEMLQGLLENRGIPSILQAMAVNGSLFGLGALATTPQRVLVRASQAEEARALILAVAVGIFLLLPGG